VNREDKKTRRVHDRVFVIFERSRRYRDHYRCQEKKSRRGRALGPVFRDPPTPRTRPRSLFAVPGSPPPTPAHFYIIADPRLSPARSLPIFILLYNCISVRLMIYYMYSMQYSTVSSTVYSMQYSIQYAVQYTVYSIQNNHLYQQLFTKFTSIRKAEINQFYILTYFNSLVDR
jgi:hypothetical protein